ncbi:hypothetical protein EI94DRAFT_1760121 [Lactarius quietus]|nr:hypothetical protein EI94DRAFT_1760121 [Lactarius quietus]
MDIEASAKERIKILQGHIKANILADVRASPLALPSPRPTPLALLGRLTWPGLVPSPTHGRRQHWQPLHLRRPNMSTSRCVLYSATLPPSHASALYFFFLQSYLEPSPAGRRQPHCCPHQHLNSSLLAPPNLVGDCNAMAAVVATKAMMATSATMRDEDHREVDECTRVNNNV